MSQMIPSLLPPLPAPFASLLESAAYWPAAGLGRRLISLSPPPPPQLPPSLSVDFGMVQNLDSGLDWTLDWTGL